MARLYKNLIKFDNFAELCNTYHIFNLSMLKDKPYIKRLILKRDKIENFEEYPFNISSIKNLDELEFHEDVTFIVGENGSGKSTILEAIALH